MNFCAGSEVQGEQQVVIPDSDSLSLSLAAGSDHVVPGVNFRVNFVPGVKFRVSGTSRSMLTSSCPGGEAKGVSSAQVTLAVSLLLSLSLSVRLKLHWE